MILFTTQAGIIEEMMEDAMETLDDQVIRTNFVIKFVVTFEAMYTQILTIPIIDRTNWKRTSRRR